jgi:branched-chain amino acid transport system permease protein
MIDTSKTLAAEDASAAGSKRTFKQALHHYRFILLALLVVCVLPLTLRSGSLATEVLVYALAALGCNLLLGFTGLLSFGQGIFFGLGSYTAGIVLTKLDGTPVALALLASIIVGAAASALVGWFSIRQRGTYFVMLTLAFAQMFYFLAYTTPNLTGGDDGLLSIPRPALSLFGKTLVPLATPWQYYGFVAVLFLLAFWLLMRVSHSVFGRTLLAIRDNEGARRRGRLQRQTLQADGVCDLRCGHRTRRRVARADDRHRAVVEYRLPHERDDPRDDGDRRHGQSVRIGARCGLLCAVRRLALYLWPRWLLLLGLLLIAVSLFMQRGLWGLGERIWQAVQRDTPTADSGEERA